MVPDQQGRQQVINHFLQNDGVEDVLPDALTWDVG
jgi:hypothetical protein